MTKIIKVGLDDDNHRSLKKAAEKKEVSMSAYVNQLIEDVDVANNGVKVILHVPLELTKKNKDQLEHWLQLRLDAIVNAYYPK